MHLEVYIANYLSADFIFKRTVRVISILTLHAKMTIPDSQRYPKNVVWSKMWNIPLLY